MKFLIRFMDKSCFIQIIYIQITSPSLTVTDTPEHQSGETFSASQAQMCSLRVCWGFLDVFHVYNHLCLRNNERRRHSVRPFVVGQFWSWASMQGVEVLAHQPEMLKRMLVQRACCASLMLVYWWGQNVHVRMSKQTQVAWKWAHVKVATTSQPHTTNKPLIFHLKRFKYSASCQRCNWNICIPVPVLIYGSQNNLLKPR